MPANLENSSVATGLEKVSFHSNPQRKAMPKNVQTTVQLHSSHSSNYRTIALISHTSKVMSLLFNKLSRFIISFLPRSKHLLISWLQSPSAVILEPKKIKSDTVSPSISHEVIRETPYLTEVSIYYFYTD